MGMNTSTTTRTASVTGPMALAATDVLILGIAEDAYLGEAQVPAGVDGQQIGGAQISTALPLAASSQTFTFNGAPNAGDQPASADVMQTVAATTIENFKQAAPRTADYTIKLSVSGNQAVATNATEGMAPTAVSPDATTGLSTSASRAVTAAASAVTFVDTVLATVSTGAGTTQETLDVSAATSGTYAPLSTSGIGANSLVTYNWNPSTQLTHFLAAEAAAKSGASGSPAKLVVIGDSTTRGFGSSALGWTALSYASEMTQALNQDGVAAQSDNFLGAGLSPSNGEVEDNRITLVNGATAPFIIDAGGLVVGTTAAGQGFDFNLNAPAAYDHITISYIDTGSGAVTVSVDGGPVLATLSFGDTGNTLTQTIAIPAGVYSQLNVRAVNSNPVYIQGAAFYNSASSAIEVANAGIDGWTSASADTSTYDNNVLTGSANGFGETAGVAATQPNLTLIDLGINDIQNGLTTAQTVANIAQIVATVRSAGSDAVIVIPQPFNYTTSVAQPLPYAAQLPTLRTALEALSMSQNVPIIDLSATYNDSYASLAAAGLMSDGDHPDATLYADIGSQIAGLLTNTIDGSRVACYATGTHILTPDGQTRIDALRIGDEVCTLSGEAKPVRWIGRRAISCAAHPEPARVWPICIRAHAFAHTQPARDLWVSPGHSVLCDDVLIPAEKLVNGATILQAPRDRIEYWHIELDNHDIVLAEGLPSETYLDTGNRTAFVNGGVFYELHPDFRPKHWAQTCAPLILDGPFLARTRSALLARAPALGFEITADADLHVMVDGARIEPVWAGKMRAVFVLPANGENAALRSRSFVPTHVIVESYDGRALGVLVGALQVDDLQLSLDDDPRFGDGWHRCETVDGGRRQRWTTGDTPLPWGTRLVVIDLAGRGYFWETPEPKSEKRRTELNAVAAQCHATSI